MILITGATGLIGSHLAMHLIENGFSVRAMYRKQKNVEKTRRLFKLYNKLHLFEQVEWIAANVNDVPSLELAFKNVKQVYHCAALISFNPADEPQLRKINIEGTANIVNFCLAYKIDKLCHVSSIAALGDLKEFESTITEETEWNPEKPHGDYAITKFGAEMEIWRGQQEGLNAVIINPGVVLGAGFWETGSGELFGRVKKGLKFYTCGTAGFVNVHDVVAIMQQLMNADIAGERFTIVSETKTYQEVLNQVADALKVARPKYYAKPWMTSLAWKIDFLLGKIGFRRSITKDDHRALHSLAFYSNEKVINRLNYKFRPISASIKEIVEIHKNY